MLGSIPNDIKRMFLSRTSAGSYYALSHLSKQIASICHGEHYSQRSLVRLSGIVTLVSEQYTITPSGHRYGWSIMVHSLGLIATYRRLFETEHRQYIVYVNGNISYDQACFNGNWDIIHREWLSSGELADISHLRRIALQGDRRLCHLYRESGTMRVLKPYPGDETFRPLDAVTRCEKLN